MALRIVSTVVLVVAAALHGAAADAVSPASGAPDVSVQKVLEAHTAARGGTDAIEKLANIRLVMEIREPSFTVTGDYRASRVGHMRIDVYNGDERVFSEGIDDRGAWQQAGPDAAVVPASQAGAAALRHGVELNLLGLHEMRRRGHGIAFHGRERRDDAELYVLKLTLRDGFETLLSIDAQSWQIVRRRDVRALHPDIDATEKPLEMVFEAFEPLCGVLRAMRTRQVELDTGQTVQRTRVLSKCCNVAPEALDLARPAAKPTPGESADTP